MEYFNLSNDMIELVVKFENHLGPILKPSTIRCYCVRIIDFLLWYADNDGGKPLAEITMDDVKSYWEYCRSQGRNEKPRAAFRRFFDYLFIVKIIKINPMP
jgi:site-specific recombinase XerD